MKIKLYTTKGCILCEKAKKIIKAQELDVEVIESQENDILKFRKMGIRSFPVIVISEEKYVNGKAAGEYLAMNIEELRKK